MPDRVRHDNAPLATAGQARPLVIAGLTRNPRRAGKAATIERHGCRIESGMTTPAQVKLPYWLLLRAGMRISGSGSSVSSKPVRSV